MKKKNIGNVLTIIVLIVVVVLLGELVYGYYKKQTLNISNPIVTMEVANYGTIKMELYPDIAPETVKNFIILANNGFYNGLKFHRVVEGFMIQGGDSAGDGSGAPTFADLYNTDDENMTYNYSDGTQAKSTDTYTIPGECVRNGYINNTLNLTEGIVAMARGDFTSYSPTLTTESYNSAGSQFFIMTSNNYTNLSGEYTGFAKVIEGMDIVHNIEKVECTVAPSDEEESETTSTEEKEVSTPIEDVMITSVSVETYGVDYGMPETLVPFDYMKWLYNLYGLSYNQ